MITPELLQTSAQVARALAENKPVVAPESTVIAHGLPRPINLETAQRLGSNRIVKLERLPQQSESSTAS